MIRNTTCIGEVHTGDGELLKEALEALYQLDRYT